MYLMFTDESGTPPKPDKQHPRYFVIAGIIIPESSWTVVRDALMGMMIRRKIRGEINGDISRRTTTTTETPCVN